MRAIIKEPYKKAVIKEIEPGLKPLQNLVGGLIENVYELEEQNINIWINEEMDYEIKNFIEEYRGTAIGDSIYNKRCNTNDTDFDRIQDIYNEVINF